MSSPTGITVDKDGNIYVADTDNDSIQKFDRQHVHRPMGRRAVVRNKVPFTIRAVSTSNADGHVYVADTGNNRVQRLDADGNPMKSWGKFGFAWRGADLKEKFDAPWSVTTDLEGNIYVTDTGNARVQKYKGERQHSLVEVGSGRKL